MDLVLNGDKVSGTYPKSGKLLIKSPELKSKSKYCETLFFPPKFGDPHPAPPPPPPIPPRNKE
jgi:hypothetical protein